ncbi:MAG: response regulator [Myxococcota bacterium]|nr:response regulator [Myxococcota bacterium]
MDEVQRVLVVEDHSDSSELLCMHLERLGHSCRTACDGTSGLALAREHRPHVAIIDLYLPDMSGHDVARALRLEDPHVYLVALTGSTRAEDRAKWLESGYDEFLVKPTDFRTLLAPIAKAKQRRR